MSNVKLASQLADEIVAAAMRASEREACGLVGVNRDGAFDHVYVIANVDQTPDRFLLDPTEHFRAIEDAESSGGEIGAVFHSHPRGPGVPSETDISAPLDPDWVSFIVSPLGDTWVVRAFSIRDGVSTELPVSLVASSSSLR